MRKKILFLLFSILTLSLFSQNTVGTISVNQNVYDGYTLFSSHKKTYLIDNCGKKINEWSSEYTPGNAVYLLPNGNILRTGREDGLSQVTIGGSGGIIEIFDWDGNLLWQYRYNADTYRQHHDVFPMPNGNVLILAATVMTKEEAIEAGRNPSLISTDTNTLFNEQIFEVEPIGSNDANIVWEWNIKDHLIQEFDSSKNNFGIVKDNPNKLDVNFLNGQTVSSNWLHINSIQYDELLDQIVISSRFMSEVWIIDHSTTTEEAATSTGGKYGKGGDILYRWGNPQSYQHGDESDRMLFGQHYPYYVRNTGTEFDDKIILFNNGFGRTPHYSEVNILTPPQSSPGNYVYDSGNSYGPVSLDYNYSDPVDKENFFSSIVSGAQVLPNGNILVCQGINGYVFELDKDKNKVWEYIIPSNNILGTIFSQFETPVSNLTFRATKYSKNYSAFNGRTIVTGDPIETNPDLTPCNVLSNEDFTAIENIKFANPTNGKIDFNLELDKITVYSILGKKLVEITKSKRIDFSNFKSGLYLLKLTKGNSNSVKKVIKK